MNIGKRVLFDDCIPVAVATGVYRRPGHGNALHASRAEAGRLSLGTWELVSTKNVKTGIVTPSPGTQWLQFTRSRWIFLNMVAGRKPVTAEEFSKLSPEEQVKTGYARVWNGKKPADLCGERRDLPAGGR